jgi:hypothetical protein
MKTRIIQVRPSHNPQWQRQKSWEVFEADGVCPVYCGDNGRQNALDYAQQRARSGLCDIQVLDENWNVVEKIRNEDLKPVA